MVGSKEEKVLSRDMRDLRPRASSTAVAKAASRYTPTEEFFNALTHGLGAGLGIAALILLIIRAVSIGREGSLMAAIIFGSALIFLYLSSALHHAMPEGGLKKLFLSFDHTGIYLLIAGSYTPFCLLMPDGQKWILFAIIWSIAAIGMAVQITAFATGRNETYEKYAFLFYIAMGWVPMAWAGNVVFGALAPTGVNLLVAGALAYCFGVIFYLWRRFPFNHAVWHLFVIAGSTLHFFSIFLYVIPKSIVI
jgi:hemolysin III